MGRKGKEKQQKKEGLRRLSNIKKPLTTLEKRVEGGR